MNLKGKVSMKKKFLFWFSGFLALLSALYMSFEAGYLQFLYDSDNSKLTIVSMVLFLVMYTRLGILLYSKNSLTEYDLDPGYESAEYCLALGLLGTVIGFIIMLSTSLGSVNLDDAEAIKTLFSSVMSGMSTALLTTGVGLVTGSILRITHYLAGRK